MKCQNCGAEIVEASCGMNIPALTPGPVYWCHDCVPVDDPEEIIKMFESFINPPKEES